MVSMVLAGILVAKFQHDWVAHSGVGWTVVAFIWVYIAAFGATWGPVSWTYISEIFPLSIRSKGVSIGASSNWLNNFAVAFFVPPMLKAWTWGTYIFFAIFSAGGGLFVWYFAPETKDKTLEELDLFFGGSESSIAEADRARMQRINEELGLAGVETVEDLKTTLVHEPIGEHHEVIDSEKN